MRGMLSRLPDFDDAPREAGAGPGAGDEFGDDRADEREPAGDLHPAQEVGKGARELQIPSVAATAKRDRDRAGSGDYGRRF